MCASVSVGTLHTWQPSESENRVRGPESQSYCCERGCITQGGYGTGCESAERQIDQSSQTLQGLSGCAAHPWPDRKSNEESTLTRSPNTREKKKKKSLSITTGNEQVGGTFTFSQHSFANLLALM